jgi:hypothetical protein
MSALKNSLQANKNLNRLEAFRKSDDFNWQLAEYSKLDEIISQDFEVVKIGYRHLGASSWQTSALVAAAMLLAQQQLNGVAVNQNENFHIYLKMALDRKKLSFPQSSLCLVFPHQLVDTKPIGMAEEPKTKPVDESLETIFNGLVKKWKEETRGYSVTSQKYAHPSYQSILVLGPEVVPFILRDLQTNGGRWFEALKALTKRNDITKPSDSYDDAVKAWIAWGKDNKLIS